MLKTKGFTSIKEDYFIDLGSDDEYDHIYAICFGKIGVKAWSKVDFNHSWQFVTKYDDSTGTPLPKDGLLLHFIAFQWNFKSYKIYYLGRTEWYTKTISYGWRTPETDIYMTCIDVLFGKGTSDSIDKSKNGSDIKYNHEICFERGNFKYHHEVSHEVLFTRNFYKYQLTDAEVKKIHELFGDNYIVTYRKVRDPQFIHKFYIKLVKHKYQKNATSK